MVLLSGCPYGTGVSVEGNAGFAYSRVRGGSGAETRELGATAGLSLAVELDWLRDSNLGAGAGVQTLRTPSAPGGLTTYPARVWAGASIDDRGWTLRPRAYAGFSLGIGEDGFAMDGYFAGGASYHFGRGAALHAMVGPQLIYADDDDTDDNRIFRGWGGQLRIRLFRMFEPDCDPAARTAITRPQDDPC